MNFLPLETRIDLRDTTTSLQGSAAGGLPMDGAGRVTGADGTFALNFRSAIEARTGEQGMLQGDSLPVGGSALPLSGGVDDAIVPDASAAMDQAGDVMVPDAALDVSAFAPVTDDSTVPAAVAPLTPVLAGADSGSNELLAEVPTAAPAGEVTPVLPVVATATGHEHGGAASALTVSGNAAIGERPAPGIEVADGLGNEMTPSRPAAAGTSAVTLAVTDIAAALREADGDAPALVMSVGELRRSLNQSQLTSITSRGENSPAVTLTDPSAPLAPASSAVAAAPDAVMAAAAKPLTESAIMLDPDAPDIPETPDAGVKPQIDPGDIKGRGNGELQRPLNALNTDSAHRPGRADVVDSMNREGVIASTERTGPGQTGPAQMSTVQTGQGQTVTNPVDATSAAPVPDTADAADSLLAPRSPLSGVSSTSTGGQPAGEIATRPTFHVNTPAGQPGFEAEFASRVRWLAGQDMNRAEIRLNPANLGSIEIQISTEDDKATVTIFAQNAATREMIEQSMPRLREAFAGAGIDLAEGSVSEHEFARQDSGSDHAAGDGGRGGFAGDDNHEDNAAPVPRATTSAVGLVDTFI